MTRLSRARAANTAIFFATGAVNAAWATRVPAIQAELDLSAGQLALAILGLEGGAVAGLPAGGVLVAKLGSPAALRLGFAIFPPALVAAALASNLPALAAALAAMSLGTSVVDVAMNAQGVELERRAGRPLLSRMHAGHPFGLVAGGLAGALAASTGTSLTLHFAIAAGLGMALGLGATRWLVRERGTGSRERTFARPNGRLALLGVVAFCAFLLDAAAAHWSAVHLRGEHGAAAGLAAAAFTAFAVALALGRVAGDRLVQRVGRVRLLQASGALCAAGGLAVVAAPTAGLALAGWATLGLGVAVVAPTVFGAAPEASELSAPVAIAAVSTIGYFGSFSGPPLVGLAAELTDLTTALCLLVAIGALMPVLAARLGPEPTVTK